MSIDLGGLAQAIVNALISGLQSLLAPLPEQFAIWLSDQLNEFWLGIWHSGANLFGTPLGLTIDYPPSVDLSVALGALVPAIAVLAAAVLGLRTIWNSMAAKPDHLRTDLTHNLFLGLFLASASVILLRQAFQLAQIATDAFGLFNYRPDFDPHDITNFTTDFLITVVGVILMIIFGFRLMLRGAYRLVLLMACTPFAPVASIMWAFPSLRWIASRYWITVGGWLVGGVLAVAIVSLGVQITADERGGGGVLALFFPVALVMLAHDVMVWIPQWGTGRVDISRPGLPGSWQYAGAAAAGGAAGMAAGAAGGAASGAAAGAGSAGLTAGGAGAAAGALGPPGLGAGYD